MYDYFRHTGYPPNVAAIVYENSESRTVGKLLESLEGEPASGGHF